MRAAFDPHHLAERTMDRCCEGDPWPTLCNLVRFQVRLARLAVSRCVGRVRNQPRSLIRFRRNPEFGGRDPGVPIPPPSDLPQVRGEHGTLGLSFLGWDQHARRGTIDESDTTTGGW